MTEIKIQNVYILSAPSVLEIDKQPLVCLNSTEHRGALKGPLPQISTVRFSPGDKFEANALARTAQRIFQAHELIHNKQELFNIDYSVTRSTVDMIFWQVLKFRAHQRRLIIITSVSLP